MTDILEDIGPLPNLPRKKGRKKRTVTPEERARKTSPEWKEHLKEIGFQKGREKTGGTVATPKDTKEWLASKSQDVAELLYDMAFDIDIPAKERMKAAMWVAEMSMSKAPTQSNVQVNHSVSIAEMLAEINQARQNAPKAISDAAQEMIDITPVELVEAEPVKSTRKRRTTTSDADV